MTDTEPTENGRSRGRPFVKGNSGRRLGSKNKTTLIAASLLAGEAEQLLRAAIEIAKAGDKDMLKFLLARVLPKERAIRLDLPVLDFASDAVDAFATVTAAVSAGELTPSEGAALGSLIGSYSRTMDTSELEEKIDRLEDKLRPR
jgi:hypothetical protein